MRLKIEEAVETETTFGKTVKIVWIVAEDMAGQPADRTKYKDLAEVEQEIARLRSDLDQMLQAARSYLT